MIIAKNGAVDDNRAGAWCRAERRQLVWDIAFRAMRANGISRRRRLQRSDADPARDTLAEVGQLATAVVSRAFPRRARSPSIRTAISTPVRFTTRSACRNSRQRQPQHRRRGTSSSL
jgi:hypothetical protein